LKKLNDKGEKRQAQKGEVDKQGQNSQMVEEKQGRQSEEIRDRGDREKKRKR
jgi:hypothetical protein